MNLMLKALAVGLVAESKRLRREQDKVWAYAALLDSLDYDRPGEDVLVSRLMERYTPPQVERILKKWHKHRQIFRTLHTRRTSEVRSKARAVHVARAFLADTPLNKVENPHSTHTRDAGFWVRVWQFVNEYATGSERNKVGQNITFQMRFQEWTAQGHSMTACVPPPKPVRSKKKIAVDYAVIRILP